MTTVWYDSREEAEAAEEVAIRAEWPKYNQKHNDGRAVRPAKVGRQPATCAERPVLYAIRHCMYLSELLALPAHVDLETAGRAHGLGRYACYQLATAGEFPCPVQRRGRYYRVRKSDLVTSLGLGMDGKPLPADSAGTAA